MKIAPIVSKSLDKIRLMPTNEMIPLIYLNTRHIYINEKILKRLRAGELSTNVTVATIGIIVFLMFQFDVTRAFTIFTQWNAPTTTGGQEPAPVSPSSAPVERSGRISTALQIYGPSQTQASTFVNSDGSVNLDLGYEEVLRRARFSPDFKCSFDRFAELTREY